jgi:hypothetical protein
MIFASCEANEQMDSPKFEPKFPRSTGNRTQVPDEPQRLKTAEYLRLRGVVREEGSSDE